MSRAALYRRWRPRRFSEIAGQEPVVRTLVRAIETDRVAHAYLFSGPRGTGKTSTAKVLAMGLNCVHGPTPEPCGGCESCRGIIEGSSLDVVEMDAASNRGIDEIRDLRDRVNLSPAQGRMKVYIIDEVHMLTAEAFNALLKMLEEPPSHVVFVLATTEKHRVLPTIVSRCQSFEFRRPGVRMLARKLEEIAAAEGIEAEPEALMLLARRAGGSFRDAEGLLDQLSSFAEGPITTAMVRELLGSVGSEVLREICSSLCGGRAADALRALDRLANEGKDLGQLAEELTVHLRTLLLLQNAPEVALSEIGDQEREPLEEQADEIPGAELLRMIEEIGQTRGRIRRGSDARLELELAFVRLSRGYAEPDLDDLMARIERLEKAISKGAVASSRGASPEGAKERMEENPPEVSPPEEDEVEEEPVQEDASDDLGDTSDDLGAKIASAWPGMVQELKAKRKALAAAVYENARVERFDGEVLELSFPERFFVGEATKKKNLEPLLEAIEGRFGRRPRLEARVGGKRGDDEVPPPAGGAPEEPESPAPRSVGEASEGAGGDGRIRSEQEVFELAREYFGRQDHDGGS
ncbi:DNA polymerase III subunit gamma/tau [Rubrobacter calidifluminis]|uniref:DNA polymerase III subunit gamma/tau n=1 Tax=Rubrobacter calidifluminis TaxID=1392640 RepID=UPI00235F85F2|nr:DNA polymerase III subunit gamma/tau [Rubrobacter calidifluminis]